MTERKPKLLLINSNQYKFPAVVPYGICCVASAVEENGYPVRVLDLLFSKNCEKDILDTIKEFQPEVIGIGIRNIDNSSGVSSKFFLYRIKKEIVIPCKEFFNGPIVIGGASVGINGKEMLRYFDLPYALRGDGEKNMVEFLNRFSNNRPLSEMSGLIVQRNGAIIQESQAARVADLKTLPFSKNIFRFIDLKRYQKAYYTPIPIQTKRGCPLKCSYCTYNKVEGKKIRRRDPKEIASQIEYLAKHKGFKTFEFTDSTFNLPVEHTKSVLREIIKKKIHVNLRTMALNPGEIDEELVDLMKQAGFRETGLGIESCCDTTLKKLGKNYTKNTIRKAVELIKGKKLHVNYSLLLGAPGETEETINETLSTVDTIASPTDLITIGLGIRIYKDCPIAENIIDENPEITDDNFLHPVHFEPKQLPLERMVEIVHEFSKKKTNVYIYSEIEREITSILFFSKFKQMGLTLARRLQKVLLPNQPSWLIYILYKNMVKVIGMINFVQYIRENIL